MLRRIAATIALSVILGTALGGSAVAAPPSSVATAVAPAAPPPFTPSGSKPRDFIISVLGSMLGKHTPKSWQREQIANEYRYNHSFEQIEVATGIRADATPGYLLTTDYMRNPQTKADYDLRQMELQFKGGKGGEKPLAPPITKPSKFSKLAGGAGGVLTGMTGYTIGSQFGQGIVSLFGIDARGEVCTGTGGWETLLSLATGVNCEGFHGAQDYEPNVDIIEGKPPGWSGSQYSEEFLWGTPQDDKPPVMSKMHYIGYGPDGKSRDMGWKFNVPMTQQATGQTAGVSIGGRCYGRDWAGNGILAGAPHHGYWSVYFTDGSLVSGKIKDGVGAPCNNPAGAGSIVIDRYNEHKNFSHVIFSRTGGDPQKYAVKYLAWYPEGHVLWTPGLEEDPERTFVCEITASDGQRYTAETTTFRESGEWVAPVCPELPAGIVPKKVAVDETTKGAEDQRVYEEEADESFLGWYADYPECRTGACKLDLKKKSAAIPVSCFDLAYDCADWFTQADRDTKYQCTYGMHDVALSECFVYEGVFKKERVAVGAPYSDPETGEWSGGQSAPTPGSKAMGTAVQDPTSVRECWAKGWSEFNPIEWVFTPIRCGYEWAFVPRPAVVSANVVKLGSSWDHSAPVVLPAVVSSWSFRPPPSGCDGVTVDIFFLGPPFKVLNACPGDVLEPLAKTSFVFGSIVVLVLAIITLSRLISRMFGAASLGEGRG